MGSRPTAARSSRGGSLRQRGRGEAGRPDGGWILSGWVVGWSSHSRRSSRGWPGGSRPPEPRGSNIERCRFAVFFLLFFLSSSSSPRLCVAVGIPGRWMEAGISNGCGKGPGAGGRWPGGFPHPVSFRSLGGGSSACPGGAVESPWPRSRPAWPRADLRAAPQSRVRTCVQACVRLPRAACGLACGSARAARGFARPILRPPPPSVPFGSALSRRGKLSERNETRTPENARM